MTKDTGRSIGNFVVEEEVATGGMGVVLKARQTSLDRPAILKKVRRDLTERPELTERFQREARAAAAIHHQNVVAVFDCFVHRSDHYIAQEYVDGIDLCSLMEKKGALPAPIAALILLEVVRGLEEIHAQGTVHRDIKPSNILLGRRGEVKIADFGIALDSTSSALTAPGMMIGTPPYIPPEQMMGERMDSRGDLFSLGVVLYVMLSGELPYSEPESEEQETLLQKMQKERYPPVNAWGNPVPRHLVKIIQSCLKPRPRRRVASARELRQAIEKSLGNPSPADCRDQIASWLWGQQVFEARKDETVVRITPPPKRATKAGWRLAFGLVFLAAMAAALLATGILPRPLLQSIPFLAERGTAEIPSQGAP